MTGTSERRSKRNISLILLFLFGTAGISAVCAQKITTVETQNANRPAFVSTALTIGRGTLHDDYLSISNYRGYELGIMHERLRVLPFGNGKWIHSARRVTGISSRPYWITVTDNSIHTGFPAVSFGGRAGKSNFRAEPFITRETPTTRQRPKHQSLSDLQKCSPIRYISDVSLSHFAINSHCPF